MRVVEVHTMQTYAQVQVKISASPAAIFPYLENTARHRLWNPHLLSVEPKTQLVIGTRYRTVNKILGVEATTLNTVTALIPNQLIELQSQGGTIEFSVRYELVPNDNETLISCTSTISSDSSIFPFAAPLLKSTAMTIFQTDLKKLQRIVEKSLKSD